MPRARLFPADAEINEWLRSSLVIVGGTAIGRINARLRNDAGVEFAFTPTSGQRILPPARVFPAHITHNRWLRSTQIEVPVPQVGPDDSGPPPVDRGTTRADRAEQKDLLVERLFGLLPGTAGTYTSHDNNDWGCPFTGPSYGGNAACREVSLYDDDNVDPPPPSWTAYEGGHSGWDVSHQTNRNAPFFSLTDGTVIAAGRGWRCHDIAVFDGTNTIVYLHASRIDVTDGAQVFAGETQLGLQGDACSEPARGAPPNDHLHIEVIPGEAQIRIGATQRIYARGAGLKPGSLKPCDEISADPLPYLYWWVAGGAAPRPSVQVASCISAPTNGQRINDGDLIRRDSLPDVYVVKVENGKRFRRHVVAYGLYAAVPEWDEANVQSVSAAMFGSIWLSPLVRIPGEAKSVYVVEETGEDDIVLRRLPNNAEAFDRASCDGDGVFAMSIAEYNYWTARAGQRGVPLRGAPVSAAYRCPQ